MRKYLITNNIEELDHPCKLVYDGLCAGINKKQLANTYGVPINEVNLIQKKFCTGQKRRPVADMEQEETSQQPEKVIQLANSARAENSSKKRKKYVSLTEEEKKEVLQLLAEGNTVKEVADLASVSVSQIYRIKKDAIDTDTETQIAPEPVVKQESVDTDENQEDKIPDIVCINKSVRVGLCADRHRMPVNDFIFKQALSKELMFDYDKIEAICEDYINEMIDFVDGEAQQDLIVYVTGIQCALSSLIKVAYKKHVNLTLRHYDSDTNTYHTHVIWDKFGTGACGVISELLVNSRYTYLYKATEGELIYNKSLFKVAEVHYDAAGNCKYQDMYLSKDLTSSLELVNLLAKKSKETDDKVSLYA